MTHEQLSLFADAEAIEAMSKAAHESEMVWREARAV